MRILLVEDELDGQEVVVDLLGFADISTDRVGSAEEALSILLDASDYDAVIIDLALPGMDGLALLKEIRQHPAIGHLPCMAITAYHNSGVRHEALESGFDDYLPKPLDDEHFAEAVARLASS